MSEKLSPFDIAKNINSKDGRFDVSGTGYEPFMVNRIYSNTLDTIAFADVMNIAYGLSKQMQYDFYYYGVVKNPRRFGKWNKRDKEQDIEIIKEAYGYSRQKAIEIYPLVRDKMDILKSHIDKGGRLSKRG